MDNNQVNQQAKKLYAHMKEAIQAEQVAKKAESAIFNKHRLTEGGYGPGLRDELNECRQSHASQWGPEGWRNQEFVKKQMEELQRPTEEDIQKMQQGHQAAPSTVERAGGEDEQQGREKFLANLNTNKQKQPKPRMG